MTNVKIETVEKRIHPGNWSPDGLLKLNQSLKQIIENDKKTLQKLGTNSKELGSMLSGLIEKANKSNDHRPEKNKNYKIEIIRTPGLASCPWSEEEFTICTHGEGQKYLSYIEFHITNLNNKITISGNSLMIHLIRDHGFFGGPGTKYRIEPSILYTLLKN
jgi:hypothetical protein